MITQLSPEIPLALNILYEDNHLLAVEKPAGLLSQSDASGDPDLLSLCKEYIRVTYNKPGNVYLGLVHRLDRNVSGVMIFARTSKAADRLGKQFRDHSTNKYYTACVEGNIQPDRATLEDFMVKDEANRMAQDATARTPGAKQASLSYRVIERIERYGKIFSKVEVELHTGRFHQIRFQFSKRGYPLCGDRKYGANERLPDHQIALHSIRLQVEHPTEKKTITIESPVPAHWPFPIQ